MRANSDISGTLVHSEIKAILVYQSDSSYMGNLFEISNNIQLGSKEFSLAKVKINVNLCITPNQHDIKRIHQNC